MCSCRCRWDGIERHSTISLLVFAYNSLWIVGLWALLIAARLGTVTRMLAMLVVLVSDLTIVNGFYVWPKLLPAAMLLAAAALVLTPEWTEVRRRPALAVPVATLLVLAMLGHGSTVFGGVPLAVIAVFRGLPDWRWAGVLVATGIVLYAPWRLYQRYADPPGDRLTKWMLARDIGPNRHAMLSDIASAHRDAGVGGAIHNKAENLVDGAGGGPMADQLKQFADSIAHDRFPDADGALQSIGFFYLLPSFGLLLIGAPLSAFGRWRNHIRSAEWRFATIAFASFSLGTVLWALILFGNEASRTVIYQGSYLLPILGFCGRSKGRERHSHG